jgi:hypothetical protein
VIDPLPLPHPEFGLAEVSAINLPKVWCDRRTADYLAHCVARNPGDLRAHARRIAVHHALGEDQELAAAVIDLFIVLGDKGVALKRLLFIRHDSELRRTRCYPALAGALDGALSPHAANIDLPASLFWTEVDALGEDEVRLRLIETLNNLGLTDEANDLKTET